MGMRSVEFVGKAEQIKSHERSVEALMKKLETTLSGLLKRGADLERQLSFLYDELQDAQSNRDNEGKLNNSRIVSIMTRINRVYDLLHDNSEAIKQVEREIHDAQNEYVEVEEEKQQILYEIQLRARTASQDATKVKGMSAAWASVSASLNQKFQENFDALAQAAKILGGDVSTIEGVPDGKRGGGGRNNKARGGYGTGVSSGAVAIAASGTIATLGPTSNNLISGQTSNQKLMAGRGTILKGSGNIKDTNFSSSQQSNSAASNSRGKILPKPSTFSSKTALTSEQRSHVSSDSGNQKEGRWCGLQSSHKKSIDSFKNQGNAGHAMVARRGRNQFVDSLIVQDWELGRYTEPNQSAYRKNMANRDYVSYINNPEHYEYIEYVNKPVIYIDPATIHEIRGSDNPGFWSYKNTEYSSYIDMARQIPAVYSLAKSGSSLSDIAARDDIIGACARNYFLNDDITVTRVGNAYILGDQGRHRVMAALIAGVNIPVRVTDEYIKTKGSIEKKAKNALITEKGKSKQFREDFADNSKTIKERIANADKKELVNLVRNEQLARKANFGEMDIQVARELVDSIKWAKDKYPFLEFSFIGSTQVLNHNLKESIQTGLTQLYIKNNPQLPIEDIMSMVERETELYMSDLAIEEDDLAVSVTVQKPEKIVKPKPGEETEYIITEYIGDFYHSRLNGISINTDRAKDYGKLCNDLKNAEKNGASPKACASVQYLVYHEIAHQLDNYLDLSTDPEIFGEYLKHIRMSKSEQVDNVCTYAAKNIHEFIAEAWAESQCSATPRRVAKLIGEKVDLAAIAYMNSKKGGGDNARERVKER